MLELEYSDYVKQRLYGDPVYRREAERFVAYCKKNPSPSRIKWELDWQQMERYEMSQTNLTYHFVMYYPGEDKARVCGYR